MKKYQLSALLLSSSFLLNQGVVVAEAISAENTRYFGTPKFETLNTETIRKEDPLRGVRNKAFTNSAGVDSQKYLNEELKRQAAAAAQAEKWRRENEERWRQAAAAQVEKWRKEDEERRRQEDAEAQAEKWRKEDEERRCQAAAEDYNNPADVVDAFGRRSYYYYPEAVPAATDDDNSSADVVESFMQDNLKSSLKSLFIGREGMSDIDGIIDQNWHLIYPNFRSYNLKVVHQTLKAILERTQQLPSGKFVLERYNWDWRSWEDYANSLRDGLFYVVNNFNLERVNKILKWRLDTGSPDDPQRPFDPRNPFNDQEQGGLAWLLQGVGANSPEATMEILKEIFSTERAEALLNNLLGIDNDEDSDDNGNPAAQGAARDDREFATSEEVDEFIQRILRESLISFLPTGVDESSRLINDNWAEIYRNFAATPQLAGVRNSLASYNLKGYTLDDGAILRFELFEYLEGEVDVDTTAENLLTAIRRGSWGEMCFYVTSTLRFVDFDAICRKWGGMYNSDLDLDPKRPFDEADPFTDREQGMVAILIRGVNGEKAIKAVLRTIFSPERAEALLNNLLG